jgi:hypothetical protein
MALEGVAAADLATKIKPPDELGSLGGERGAGARSTHRLGEAADLVGAVAAPAVDEENGRAGDTVEVEAELPGVADQIARGKRLLVGEQEIVHLPEGTLRRRGLGRLGAQLRMRMNVAQWQVPPHVPDLAGVPQQTPGSPAPPGRSRGTRSPRTRPA